MFRVDSDLSATGSPNLASDSIRNRFHYYDENATCISAAMASPASANNNTANSINDEDEEDAADALSISLAPHEYYVFCFAAKSRLLVICTGMLATTMVGAFDTSSSLLVASNYYSYPLALQCPSNWDGAFYVKLASDQGYLYEQSHAFFPLFPLLLGLARNLVAVLTPSSIYYLNFEHDDLVFMGLLGAAINNVLFCLASVLFCRLSHVVLLSTSKTNAEENTQTWRRRRRKLAMRASILFCCNPASIFFSVAYSESLFALFAFAGMLVLSKRPATFAKRALGSFFFSLATMTRSNGSLLGMFSLFAAYQHVLTTSSNKMTTARIAKHLGQLAIITVIHALGLVSVLAFAWWRYCHHASDDSVMVARPWCAAWPPNIYSFVQAEYWNIGLFNYYEAKQIPNFLLALPALAISLAALVWFPRIVPNLPAPFYLQLLVSLVLALTVMHVQVFTRLVCSSCPLFYWYAAHLTQRKSSSPISYFVLLYFTFYLLLGTSMFCAYFPWT